LLLEQIKNNQTGFGPGKPDERCHFDSRAEREECSQGETPSGNARHDLRFTPDWQLWPNEPKAREAR
jgi:hypothetical protein